VKKWRFGLPCQGLNESPIRKNRIVLAGDRFGEWPSMNSAVSSGGNAAISMRRILSRAVALDDLSDVDGWIEGPPEVDLNNA